jgi:hypothetical protein
MKRPRDERGLMSRLPEDDAYWNALADRIVSDASERLRANRRGASRWWRDLSRLSAPLALTAAASIAGALLWLPDLAEERADDVAVVDAFGLAPTGPLADRLVGSPAPPSMATLIVTPDSEASR